MTANSKEGINLLAVSFGNTHNEHLGKIVNITNQPPQFGVVFSFM